MTKKFSKKILLLSTVPPCSNYSGGQVLEHLCHFLPKGSLVCFCLLDKGLSPEISKNLAWIPIEYSSKPADGWPKLPSIITPLLSLAGESYHALFSTTKIAEKIIVYGKKHQIDLLWITLQGQTTIRLAMKVARALKVPLLVEVWDDPVWWLKDNHIDWFSRKLIMRNFALALKKAQNCATASWLMAEAYQKEYQAKTVPFLPSLKKSWAVLPSLQIHSANELIIGVVGQLYSAEEWSSLIAALDLLNWKIGNRKIIIRLLGSYAHLYSYRPTKIEFLGYHSQKEAVELMSKADILYCPYIFNPAFKKVTELSFPGKLITYLAAGRPVFFHGPSYAGPGIFLKQHQAGFICTTLEPNEIGKKLTQIVKDKKLYAQLAKNSSNLFKEYFTFESLRKNFAKFLGVCEESLENGK